MRISDWSSDVCSSDLAGLGTAKSPRQEARYPGIHFSQFTGAERIAAKYGFSRDDLDRFALESHHRAAAATTRGDFADEIVPLTIQTPEGEQQDRKSTRLNSSH